MNGTSETKSEIRARIEELNGVLHMFAQSGRTDADRDVMMVVDRRTQLRRQLDTAQEDLFTSILRSHKAICAAKQMDEMEAFGNDPAVYYTLGVCGEAGEMANGVVKAQRNRRGRAGKVLAAVKSELPDVVIYAFILAYVCKIDLAKLIDEKVEIVCRRAAEGYYGGPLEAE